MNLFSLTCSQCKKQLSASAVKYHTADQKHVFCDAECSVKWYQANREGYGRQTS